MTSLQGRRRRPCWRQRMPAQKRAAAVAPRLTEGHRLHPSQARRSRQRAAILAPGPSTPVAPVSPFGALRPVRPVVVRRTRTFSTCSARGRFGAGGGRPRHTRPFAARRERHGLDVPTTRMAQAGSASPGGTQAGLPPTLRGLSSLGGSPGLSAQIIPHPTTRCRRPQSARPSSAGSCPYSHAANSRPLG